MNFTLSSSPPYNLWEGGGQSQCRAYSAFVARLEGTFLLGLASTMRSLKRKITRLSAWSGFILLFHTSTKLLSTNRRLGDTRPCTRHIT